MGFNRIRSNINEAYSNAFLYKVIEDFPTDFAKVTLTDTSDQYGLKRITSDPSMAEFETTSHKVTDYLFTLDTSDIKRPAILLIDKEHPNEDLHEN